MLTRYSVNEYANDYTPCLNSDRNYHVCNHSTSEHRNCYHDPADDNHKHPCQYFAGLYRNGNHNASEYSRNHRC